MKLSSILLSAAGSLLLAGCNSLDNPVTNLFHGIGNDARVYNSQTGQWEYPPEKPEKRQKKVASTTPTGTPGSASFNDTRYWDPQRNQWIQPDQPRTATPLKAKPTPASADAAVASTTPQAAPPPPPPPRPANATGVYNSSTGKIDWQTSDADVPHGATAPEPKKRWYWPF